MGSQTSPYTPPAPLQTQPIHHASHVFDLPQRTLHGGGQVRIPDVPGTVQKGETF